MIYRSDRLATACPDKGRVLPTIYVGDKYERGVRLNFTEERQFSGICSLGANQLVKCYGYHSPNTGFNRFDFISRCEECPYATNDTRLEYEHGHETTPHSYFDPLYLQDVFSRCIEEKAPKSFVYYISDGQFVKIGKANNVESRLCTLQCGNVRDLKVLAIIPCKDNKSATSVEGSLHAFYYKYRVCREWYDIFPLVTKKYGIADCFSPNATEECEDE